MKQGDVWLVDLNPTIGAEIKKTRPAVIVNDDQLGKLPLKIIVPITEWKEHYDIASWMVEIEASPENGLAKKSAIDCFQIRCISENRLIKQIGHIMFSEFLQIQEAIIKVIGYSYDNEK